MFKNTTFYYFYYMAEMNNRKQDGGRTPNPMGSNNGQKPKKNWIVYAIYAVILMSLGYMLLNQDGAGKPQPIKWAKLETILEKHDYSRIVVVNQEYAEVYIKSEALKTDTAYKDLLGRNMLNQQVPENGFYRYEFVTFESFEKDLEKVEERTGERIDLTPEKRTSMWREVLVIFGPFLILILFFVIMSRVSQKQMRSRWAVAAAFSA